MIQSEYGRSGVFGTQCAKAAAFKQINLEYRRAFLCKAPFEDTLWLLTSVMNSVDQYRGGVRMARRMELMECGTMLSTRSFLWYNMPANPHTLIYYSISCHMRKGAQCDGYRLRRLFWRRSYS